ncbi:MAG: hypothetical protein ACLVC1_05145 [Mediterraneibacter gnavus]
MLQRIGTSRMTMFFVIAVIISIVMYFLMNKSKLGYEITAIGKIQSLQEATGMNRWKKNYYYDADQWCTWQELREQDGCYDQFKHTLSFRQTRVLAGMVC